MYKVFFSWEAQEDLEEIMDNYDRKKANSGLVFFAKVDKVLGLLESTPKLFKKKILHFRRAIIGKSPYVIYYQIIEEDKDVEILAILHGKRGSDFIKRKLNI